MPYGEVTGRRRGRRGTRTSRRRRGSPPDEPPPAACRRSARRAAPARAASIACSLVCSHLQRRQPAAIRRDLRIARRPGPPAAAGSEAAIAGLGRDGRRLCRAARSHGGGSAASSAVTSAATAVRPSTSRARRSACWTASTSSAPPCERSATPASATRSRTARACRHRREREPAQPRAHVRLAAIAAELRAGAVLVGRPAGEFARSRLRLLGLRHRERGGQPASRATAARERAAPRHWLACEPRRPGWAVADGDGRVDDVWPRRPRGCSRELADLARRRCDCGV